MSVAALKQSIDELNEEVKKIMYSYCAGFFPLCNLLSVRDVYPVTDGMIVKRCTSEANDYNILVDGAVIYYGRSGTVKNIDECMKFINDYPQHLKSVADAYTYKFNEGTWRTLLDKYAPLLFEVHL